MGVDLVGVAEPGGVAPSRPSGGAGLRAVASALGLALWAAIPLAGDAAAACMPAVEPSRVADFMDHPRALVGRYPNGGSLLTGEIRILAPAKQGTLGAIESAIRSATRLQKAAIGRGLAQARLGCIAETSPLPRRIDDLVRRLGDADLSRAYAQVTTVDDRAAEGAPLPSAPPPEEKSRPLGLGGPLALPGATPGLSDLSDPLARRSPY